MQRLIEDLEQLLHEPRDVQADLVVSRVRAEMDAEARRLVGDRPVVVVDPLAGDEPHEPGALSPEAIIVQWLLVHPAACLFLGLLGAWEERGLADNIEAVKEAAGVLVSSWSAVIRSYLLTERVDEFGLLERENDREYQVTAMRGLALQGLVVDTGKRRRGRTVWAPSNDHQQHGTWDA